MNAKHIVGWTLFGAVIAGCSAAPGDHETTASTDQAVSVISTCIGGLPAPQWWDGTPDPNPNDLWVDLSWEEQRPEWTWTDPATGNTYWAFVAIDAKTLAVTSVRWVADANLGYFACVNEWCNPHPSGPIQGGAPIQDPGGDQRILVPGGCGGLSCTGMTPPTPPPVTCVPSTLPAAALGADEVTRSPTTQGRPLCSLPQNCQPSTDSSGRDKSPSQGNSGGTGGSNGHTTHGVLLQ
jgi:hypothetical protein